MCPPDRANKEPGERDASEGAGNSTNTAHEKNNVVGPGVVGVLADGPGGLRAGLGLSGFTLIGVGSARRRVSEGLFFPLVSIAACRKFPEGCGQVRVQQQAQVARGLFGQVNGEALKAAPLRAALLL